MNESCSVFVSGFKIQITMKQYLFVLLAFFLIVNSIQCQSKWTWGIQVEMGLSGKKEETIRSSTRGGTEFTTISSYNTRPAIGGGLWINYQLFNRLGLRSGLQYTNTGDQSSFSSSSKLASAKVPAVYSSSSYSLRIQRLQLPLIVEFRFAKVKFNPRIGAGFLFSKDFIKSIDERIVDISNTPAETNKHWRFPKSSGLTRVQLKANISLRINEQLELEFNQLFSKMPSVISWFNNTEYTEFNKGWLYFCGVGLPDKIISTQYHHISSLIFRYTL